MISVTAFETIRALHLAGTSKREIARQTGYDIKTVRRALRKIERGASEPVRTSPGSKLDPYRARIVELAGSERTAFQIYLVLREQADFDASYELVKKYVARLRIVEPRVFERLEHPPGAEVQIDFGELTRVDHHGSTRRTWAFVASWPHSRFRYVEVVLDQTVPTFLTCIQNALVAAGGTPSRLSIDNLASGVLREHFYERSYQREFSKLCTHYGTMPNAVRPRTPTDKGAVENSVGALKRGLRGRTFATLDDLQTAVHTWTREMNERRCSVNGKRPNDLIATERRVPLPEPYPIAAWSEHLVRTDCHVQVRTNFYSAPYKLVGKRVVVRVDARTVTIYDEFASVASHERRFGRGETVTDRAHYPPHKQKPSQEVHRDRAESIRSVGPGAAAFYAGLLTSREHVHSDAYRALLALIEKNAAGDIDRACARAVHYGNYSVAALRNIIERKLFELPLDDLSDGIAPITPPSSPIVICRSLDAYAALLGGTSC